MSVVQIASEAGAQPPVNRNAHHGQKQPSQFIHDPATLFATPAYYLKTPGLAALLEQLQQTINGRGAIQVIIAEHGRGKSALLRQLVTEGASRWLLCYIHADYHLGVDHIIEGLGQFFFPQEDVDFESLVHGLVTYGHREPYPVVIVDDAHNLSAYAVEALANIKQAVAEQGGDIDIILAAPPEFRKVVNGYGLTKFREKWIEVHSLPRFIEEETIEYLKTRFNDKDGTRFTPSQLQIIHRRGCGIPSCINYHAELALGHVVSDERLRMEHEQIATRKKKQPYYLGGAAAALLLIVLILSMVFTNEPSEELTTVAMRPVTSSTSPPVAVKSEVVAKEVEAKSSKPAEINKVVKKPVENKVVKTPPAAAEKPKVVTASRPVVASTVTEPTPAVVKKEVSPPVEKEVVAKQSNTENRQPVAASESVPKAVTRSDNDIPGNEWLLAQSPDSFTIQLAGSPSEKDIIRYIRRSSLEGELAYVYINRKNRDGLYVVLYGSFKTKEAAHGIVDFFPPELRKNRPWIRQVSTLQNLLDSE